MPINGSRRRSPEAATTPQIQSNSSFKSSESSSQESTDDQIQDIDLMYTNASKSETSTSSGPPTPVHTSLGKHKLQQPQLFSSDSEDSNPVPRIKQKKNNNNYYSTNHEERSTDCIDSKKIISNSFDSDSEDY